MGYSKPRQTHTVVTLELCPTAFKEIATKLKEAGYEHVFLESSKHGPTRIDMTGIAVEMETFDPALKDQYPMVLYMRSKKDAEEFIAAIKEAKPGMIEKHL